MLLRCTNFSTKILLAMAGLALGAAPVSAGESPWQLTVGFGQSDVDARFGSRHSKAIDDESDAVAISLGYAVNPHLGIEVGYHDLGSHRGFGSPCRETDDSCIERLATLGLCVEGTDCTEVLVGLDAELTGVSVAAVPRWPIGERFSATGKVGLMAWRSEINGDAGFGKVGDFDGEDLLLGIGLHYELPTGFGVSLQHEEIDLDLSSTVLGLTWRF